MCICQSQSPNLSLPSFPLGNYKFVFYVKLIQYYILSIIIKTKQKEILTSLRSIFKNVYYNLSPTEVLLSFKEHLAMLFHLFRQNKAR